MALKIWYWKNRTSTASIQLLRRAFEACWIPFIYVPPFVVSSFLSSKTKEENVTCLQTATQIVVDIKKK